VADDNHLIDRAMMLRGAAPEEWQQFVEAVRLFAAGATADMLKVPVADLPHRQGIALGLSTLAQLLKEAPKHYEQRRNRNG